MLLGAHHAKLDRPRLCNEMKMTFKQILQEAPVNENDGKMTLHDESRDAYACYIRLRLKQWKIEEEREMKKTHI